MYTSTTEDRFDARREPHLPTVLSPRVIGVSACTFFLAGVGLAAWFMFGFDLGPDPVQRVESRFQAIRAAGAIMVAFGGAAGLLLAARRQQSNEIRLWQASRDYRLQAQAANDARLDAARRQLIEYYAKAVEQLCSPYAFIRLGALLTLERLAADDQMYREPVVNALKGYLRMSIHQADQSKLDTQELQVRDMAERILDLCRNRPDYVELSKN
jgi:uncharacterized protein YsxB (DUF464 family)